MTRVNTNDLDPSNIPQYMLDKIVESRIEEIRNPSTKYCPFCRQYHTPKRKVKTNE